MSYEYRFINKQVLKTGVGFTLLLEDTDQDESQSVIRIEKCFMVDEKVIDSEFLRIEAKKEIKRIEEEKSQTEVIEILPEDAASE